MKIDDKFFKTLTTSKIKISLSGCPNSCGESAVRDIGLIRTLKGWKMLVGGTCDLQIKKGKILTWNLSDDEVIDMIGKHLIIIKKMAQKK